MAGTEGREAGASLAPRGVELDQFFEATKRRAFGLAVRITGDPRKAEEATATAYRSLAEPYTEAALFEAIRAEALRLAGPQSESAVRSYQIASAVRSTIEGLSSLERTAIDLAHTGGLDVPAIAAVLGEEPAAVRKALRTALLSIGAVAAKGAHA